jgi:predicted CXXCH cytochrome family protein
MKVTNLIKILVLLLVSVITSCSPKTGSQVLNFLFDGVPETIVKNDVSVRGEIIPNDSISGLLISENDAKPQFFYHQPYKQKKCTVCHYQQRISKLTQTQPELCFQCHKNIDQSTKVLHAPVEAGFCTECHNPHSANNKMLLKMQNNNLCMHCHDSSQMIGNQFHLNLDENCINCHNPHGGKNKYALQAGSCYKCHINFADIYPVVHGPVASEFCDQCHNTHITNKNEKLMRNNQALCVYCHDINEVQKNEAHDGIEDTPCTLCHNPHGGDDKFMLN